MPESLDACVEAVGDKADNPWALCNWMRENQKGFFASEGGSADLDACIREFCQEGKNKGMPGPCPEEGKEKAGAAAPSAAAAAPVVAPASGTSLPAIRAAIEKAGLEMRTIKDKKTGKIFNISGADPDTKGDRFVFNVYS